jgi:hypothetical protein
MGASLALLNRGMCITPISKGVVPSKGDSPILSTDV